MLKKFFSFTNKKEEVAENKCQPQGKIDYKGDIKFCFNYSFEANIRDMSYSSSKGVQISLVIKCKELDINIVHLLMFRTYDGLQIEDLESILNMTNEDIENLVLDKVKEIMKERNKVENIESIVEKINGKKGELYIKINDKVVDK